MNRALVTGATGFLGSQVATALARRGVEVVALVRSTSDRSRLAAVPVAFVEGDVTDAASVRRALDGVDRVFHCAAYVEFGSGDPGRMRAVNVGGTEAVLGAAADAAIPAVHVSSAAALGPTGDEARDESWWSPEPPEVAYEETKRAGHLVARDLAAAGADVRIGVPGGIYGPGDDTALGQLIRTYQRWPLPVGYLPEVRHSTVHVADCAEGLVLIAERGRPGREYILCAEIVTVREWFDLITGGAGRRSPRWFLGPATVDRLAAVTESLLGLAGQPTGTVGETVAMATRSLAFDGSRARDELGWRPRPLELGMTELGELNRRRS